MKNFLSRHYEHYYVLAANGQWVETTRAECFSRHDVMVGRPPYRQRWFYDGFGFSYIVRLPLGEHSEMLHRFNEASNRKEQRYQADRFGCVLRDTGECDNDCNNCQRKKYPQTVELDKPLYSDENGEAVYLEIAADDPFRELEDKTEIDAALSKLLPQQSVLIRKVFYEGYSIQEIADAEGVDKSAISHRLERACKKLKSFLD